MRFNKNLVLALTLMTVLSAGVLAQTYYVGDSPFNLPQISVQGTYTNDATHHTFLACLSSLDGISNAVSINQGDSCELNPVSFNPDSSEIGNHTYASAIYFTSRQWNPSTRIWETTSNGTDNSQTLNFQVMEYPIPSDDFSITSWLNGLVQNIQAWFCANLGLFCPAQLQTSWCYQETANVSTLCGGLNTGSYSSNFASDAWYDGLYNTGIIPYFSGINFTGYVNYTKPSESLNTSLWQVQDSSLPMVNLTIPQSCWNYNSSKILFKITTIDNSEVNWSCYDGSEWNVLRTASTYEVYEEAMYWNFG